MSAFNIIWLGESKTMSTFIDSLASVLFVLVSYLRELAGSIKLSPAGSVQVSSPDTPQHLATVGN